MGGENSESWLNHCGTVLFFGCGQGVAHMLIEQVKKTIREYRGPIFMTCHTRDDVYYVRVFKSDLLEAIKVLRDHQIDASFTDGTLYIDTSVDEG
jgi:hypothetical protein